MKDNEISGDETGQTEDKSSPTYEAGRILKQQREESNMTQEEVASKLNLDVSYIIAIEEDDFSEITCISYVNGYIRSYARLLKIPELQVSQMCYQQDDSQSELVPNYMGQGQKLSESSRQGISWAILFIVVMGLLLASWWFIRQ